MNINVIDLTLLGLWTSIILSYSIALITETIELPPHVPMISDLWLTTPGEIISRVFIPPFIYLWSIFCWKVCNWLDRISWKRGEYEELLYYTDFEPSITNKLINYINRYVCQYGILNFLTCIAINEHDNDKIHSITAFTFFCTQFILMTVVIVHLYVFKYKPYKKTVLWLGMLLSIIGSIIISNSYKWRIAETYVAALEWTSVAIISGFHWSLKRDLTVKW